MRLSRLLCNKNIALLIDSYSNYNPSPLSLKKFTDFGKNLGEEKKAEWKQNEFKSFMFLKEELLVRIALMSKEMHYLPDKLINTSSVQLVHSWYLKSFEEILSLKQMKPTEDKLKGDILRFNKCLKNIVERHNDVVQNMAMGIVQMRENYGIDSKSEQNIQYFLDRFLMSRISIRMLINQHLLLFTEQESKDPAQIGAIDLKCNVLHVLEDAFTNAKYLCDQYYLASPDGDFEVKNVIDSSDLVEVVYVPSHLYHMAFELYKNAMRAVIEHHGEAAKTYPSLKTLIVKGKEDISIRITDFGGGISMAKLNQVFKYMYSTAPRPAISSDIYSTTTIAPLAGYGYGLPLSRLYARYFNGDLQLSSLDGYSTDAYIYLKTLSENANESLPLHNFTTVNYYKNSRDPTSDWTN